MRLLGATSSSSLSRVARCTAPPCGLFLQCVMPRVERASTSCQFRPSAISAASARSGTQSSAGNARPGTATAGPWTWRRSLRARAWTPSCCGRRFPARAAITGAPTSTSPTAASWPRGYDPQLEVAEYRRGGPFAALSAWLGAHMRRFGFYRPYTRRGRGVQPEPWHLSYAPVARPALSRMTLAPAGGRRHRRGHRWRGGDPGAAAP